uniref:Uncharacterized protein n=1 Tax=Arundo donax TaxID=35708 RepID=A0A0A9H3Z9_ARUDO
MEHNSNQQQDYKTLFSTESYDRFVKETGCAGLRKSK